MGKWLGLVNVIRGVGLFKLSERCAGKLKCCNFGSVELEAAPPATMAFRVLKSETFGYFI